MEPLSTIIIASLTWAGERLGDQGVSAIRARLKSASAKAELALITAAALESAIEVQPLLAADFRSEGFLHGVIGPLAIDRLNDPTADTDAEKLADQYIDRFIDPWIEGDVRAAALRDILQTDRPTLVQVFSAFIEGMRKGLLASDHWKDIGRDRTIEETLQKVSFLVEQQVRPGRGTVDLKTAKADANIASLDLLEWQRTINGHFIPRAELDLLASRISREPRGRTLLIGDAGSGKSALLSALTEQLQEQGVTVFALKADRLPSGVTSSEELSKALGLQGNIEDEVRVLAASGPVVLLIDQLDAVSEVMDRSSQRMKILLRIANEFKTDRRFTDGPPVHVLVSSRPFEADHDGRFRSLDAEKIKLNLPSFALVEDLLSKVEIEPSRVPPGLKETLRRPFALRLFVDLVHRGADVTSVSGAELLNAWLASANLGDVQERPHVAKFLERLAEDMTQTETLWRPADVFDAEWPNASRIAEAAGLVVRQDGKLGFSHQSWLDDFQAKSFKSGEAVAAYTWEHQDGLFARATILRALERLRRHDAAAYDLALDLLLGQAKTRRHIRHLVVDVIATQDSPAGRETGWIQRLFRSDLPLARRAANKMAQRWAGWRLEMVRTLPAIMHVEELTWTAVHLLQAEAAADPAQAINLLRSEWSAPEHDLKVFEVLWRGKLWSSWVAERVKAIFARLGIQSFAVAQYMQELVDEGRTDDAIELLLIYLQTDAVKDRDRWRLYDLKKLVEAAPLQLATALTPWFTDMVAEPAAFSSVYAQFPPTKGLPSSWEYDDDNDDSVFHALKKSFALAASSCPAEITQLLNRIARIETDEAQALVADTYACNPGYFAEAALDFLLGDKRRFSVGRAHLDDERGVGHLIQGYSARKLIEAIAPHLGDPNLHLLKAAIEAWSKYTPEALADWPAEDRRHRHQWAEEARFELLDCLPKRLFDPRTKRRLAEWRAKQPVLNNNGRMMAHWVGSPMSAEQMGRASDGALLGMLDECHDGTGWGNRPSDRRRHISESGGAVQVGRTFAELGKSDPARVLRLVRERLTPEKHENAAGTAIRELSQHDSADPRELIELIHDLTARGFASESWRQDAGWALRSISQRARGLEDQEVALLESWIVDDAQVADERIARRLNNDAINRERNKETGTPQAGPVVFGNRLGRGIGILPHDNFTYLYAIAGGLLRRDPPSFDAWLAALERHADRAEDPHIWESILIYYGQSLFWADRTRTLTLFKKLWEKFPEAFTEVTMGSLWSYRAMVPSEVQLGVLSQWCESGDARLTQAAGEIATAALLVDGVGDPLAPLAERLLANDGSTGKLGGLFATASAWSHNSGALRQRAHELLMQHAEKASGDEALAVGAALKDETLLPDVATEDLLQITLKNVGVLKAALNHRFADALQTLLLHPGFEELILSITEEAARCLLADRDGGRTAIDNDFVAIAIALQRAPGPARSRAMDLYERLLDADVYGANDAAAAALRH